MADIKPKYLMTSETNPEVLAICYAQGWCASPDHMTYEEAAAVKNIGNIMRNNGNIKHFDELEYFTSLTACPALLYCTALISIKLPMFAKTIQNQYLRGCSKLTTVTIPATMTSIEMYAFHSCSVLTSVYIYATNPPTIGTGIFLNATSKLTIYVPSESVSLYKAAAGWSSYASKIKAIPS